MKKANLLACLLSPMLAIAQPQADSLRHLIHVKGPQVHLLAQMAEATATSHPDTAFTTLNWLANARLQGATL